MQDLKMVLHARCKIWKSASHKRQLRLRRLLCHVITFKLSTDQDNYSIINYKMLVRQGRRCEISQNRTLRRARRRCRKHHFKQQRQSVDSSDRLSHQSPPMAEVRCLYRLRKKKSHWKPRKTRKQHGAKSSLATIRTATFTPSKNLRHPLKHHHRHTTLSSSSPPSSLKPPPVP